MVLYKNVKKKPKTIKWLNDIYNPVKLVHPLQRGLCQSYYLRSCAKDFSFKKGVNNVLSNQFRISGPDKNWIEPFYVISLDQENAAMPCCCSAPEMYCGL